MHPAVLDAAFQLMAVAMAEDGNLGDLSMMVPYSMKRYRVSGRVRLEEVKVHVQVLEKSAKGASAAITLYSSDGQPLMSIGELGVRRWTEGTRHSSKSR